MVQVQGQSTGSDRDQPGRVVVDDPARMNLLGLILAGIIERNLQDAAALRRFQGIEADVVVQAGQMVVTLHFQRGHLRVARGEVQRPRARVAGSLDALMSLSLGGGMVGPWLSGRLKTRGSLLLLLRLRRLLQV